MPQRSFLLTRLKTFAVLLFVACSSARPCIEQNFCANALAPEQLADPVALGALIVDARTRTFPSECFSCEEGSACASCDHLVYLAAHQLSELKTDQAAREAAAVVLDPRLHWDAGAALILSREVARMGPRVLPYLRSHTSESPLARQIVECIEANHPCI